MGVGDTLPLRPKTDIADDSQPYSPFLLSPHQAYLGSVPSSNHREHTCVLFVLKKKVFVVCRWKREITSGLVGSWELSSLHFRWTAGEVPPGSQPGKREG